MPVLLDDESTGHLWSYRDISQQKHVEQSLEEERLLRQQLSR
ncbi:MAG: hypothetical protein ACO36E_11120 [Synechocystis sp.]